MKPYVLLLAIASYWLGGDSALGQPSPPLRIQPSRPEPPIEFHRPSPVISGAIAANSKFVYVLRGDVLYQADAETLQWLHKAQLPGARRPEPAGPQRQPMAQYGPWNRDLVLATSDDGIHFASAKRFVERGGVPCVVQVDKNRLMAVFQWFPLDKRESFDKIAMATSEDEGETWTPPETVAFDRLPDYLYRQFDPTLAVLDDRRLRLYFTSENQETRRTAICSAVSEDGSPFVFEEGIRFQVEDENVVDCTVARLGDTWHMVCPMPRHDGKAYHAVSEDGLTFRQADNVSVPGTGQWIGNVTTVGDELRFYGSGRGGIWSVTSKDGSRWTLNDAAGIAGGDPAVVRTASGRYLMIVTGQLRPDATLGRPFAETKRVRPLPSPNSRRPVGAEGPRQPVPPTVPQAAYPQRKLRDPMPHQGGAFAFPQQSGRQAAGASIACNESSVFVFRNGVIYRFDGEDLRSLGTTQLDGRNAPGGLDDPPRPVPDRVGPPASPQRPQEPGGRVGEPVHSQGPEERRGDPRGRRGSDLSGRIDVRSLPDISKFAANKSDRFLVDLDDVRTGHPYLGENAQKPHSGGHVYFLAPDPPGNPNEPSTYPAIYAVADGYVTRIDEYFKLREVYFSWLGKSVSNYRYGVTLAIAGKDGAPVNFHYSIEPMTDPGDPEFYKRFILVSHGQRVKKGDIIARMYIPADPAKAQNTHIHFNLMDTGTRSFMTPSIFTDEIVRAFHAKWEGRHRLDGNVRISPCMGYRISAKENPFGTDAKDQL